MPKNKSNDEQVLDSYSNQLMEQQDTKKIIDPR